MCDSNDLLRIQSELPLIKQNPGRAPNGSAEPCEVRVMNKKGKININLCTVPGMSIRYVSDLWNTLVNMRWRWLLLVIVLINVTAYLVFALLFLLDAWVSGDFSKPRDKATCIKGMNNFTSYFMLGIETITTTGYGYFHPTEFCYLVFVTLTCSTMVTIFIDGAFISVVYAKFGRPKENVTTFSKHAVICLRDGKLCLMVRVNDNLRKHWIDNSINMFLIETNTTKQGEVLPNFITELAVKPYGMIFWPVEVVHEITPDSPLWSLSARDFTTHNFEVVVTLLGSSIQTGQLTRTQTSYLAKEIMWGYRFSPCLEYNSEKSEYVINRKVFNVTVSVDTPLCSASALSRLQLKVETSRRRKSLSGLEHEGSSI
ncbi:hypothetical protein NQ315_007095, partial [Exocentrus adspersus]